MEPYILLFVNPEGEDIQMLFDNEDELLKFKEKYDYIVTTAWSKGYKISIS